MYLRGIKLKEPVKRFNQWKRWKRICKRRKRNLVESIGLVSIRAKAGRKINLVLFFLISWF